MNLLQKTLAFELLSGMYFLVRQIDYKKGYKLYQNNMHPVKYYSITSVQPFRQLLKQDARGRLTLNLSRVRQLDGRCYIKKRYKLLQTKIIL